MEEILIGYEVAKLAKEKSFEIKTSCYYRSDEKLIVNFHESFSEREYHFDANDFKENWNRKGWVIDKSGGSCFGCELDELNYFISYSAPTQSLLQKWLREVHKLDVLVVKHRDSFYHVYCFQHDMNTENNNYTTYEEALEIGLQEALKLIKNE